MDFDKMTAEDWEKAHAENMCPVCRRESLLEMKCPDQKDRCVECCDCHAD